MSAVIWWIGAVHAIVYAVSGTAAMMWWATEVTMRRLKLGRWIVLFVFYRVRRKIGGRPA